MLCKLSTVLHMMETVTHTPNVPLTSNVVSADHADCLQLKAIDGQAHSLCQFSKFAFVTRKVRPQLCHLPLKRGGDLRGCSPHLTTYSYRAKRTVATVSNCMDVSR